VITSLIISTNEIKKIKPKVRYNGNLSVIIGLTIFDKILLDDIIIDTQHIPAKLIEFCGVFYFIKSLSFYFLIINKDSSEQ
jgi:hypothetical protein